MLSNAEREQTSGDQCQMRKILSWTVADASNKNQGGVSKQTPPANRPRTREYVDLASQLNLARITDDRRGKLWADPAVDNAAEDSADEWTYDKQPKLANGPAAREKRRSDAARWVDRGIGHGNAH